MTVNTSNVMCMLLLVVFCAALSACGSAGVPPHVTWLVASSVLGPDNESRRLDVVCDVSNGDKKSYEDVKLVITFMDHTEVEFEWPSIPPYGTKGGQRAVELKFPVTDKVMLGGSFEPLLDSSGAVVQYATEVKSAVLSYKPEGGARREVEMGMQVSRCIRRCFEELSRMQSRSEKLRKERLDRLRQLSRQE